MGFMIYNSFTRTVKGRKIMKEINNERQLLVTAKEEIYKLFRSIPLVSDVEIKDSSVASDTILSDFVIRITTEYSEIKLNAEIKMRGEKRFVYDYVDHVNKFANEAINIFIAPYVSEESAELLKANGINYMDLSGNCFVAVDVIYISVQGKPNQYIPKRSNKNIFAKSSAKSSVVLRTMLNDPFHEWQVQELVKLTGASLGMISNIKNHLIENNWAELINNRFRLKNIQDMLWEWARIYNLKIDETEEYYSLDGLANLEQQVSEWNKNHGTSVTFGAFSAAARYAPAVRYSKALVYAEIQDKYELIKDLGLKRVESGGNIIICTLYDDITTMFSRENNNSYITSPVQTILDLLSHAGRGEEAAEAIIQKEFKQL